MAAPEAEADVGNDQLLCTFPTLPSAHHCVYHHRSSVTIRPLIHSFTRVPCTQPPTFHRSPLPIHLPAVHPPGRLSPRVGSSRERQACPCPPELGQMGPLHPHKISAVGRGTVLCLGFPGSTSACLVALVSGDRSCPVPAPPLPQTPPPGASGFV